MLLFLLIMLLLSLCEGFSPNYFCRSKSQLFTQTISDEEFDLWNGPPEPAADEKNWALRKLPGDISNLKPDDYRFLDIIPPTKGGPEMTAYMKHLQWKRSLTDGERLRWQKWAVYKRTVLENGFDYSVEDYVYQYLLRKLHSMQRKASKQGNIGETTFWHTLINSYLIPEEKSARATVKAFYSALNRQNYDNIRSLWLPTDSSELILPGYDKEVIFSNK